MKEKIFDSWENLLISYLETMKVVKVAVLLALTYFVCCFLLAAVGLSNDRSDALMLFSDILMFFILKVLAFPLNLWNADYPFLMDNTAKMLESDKNPLTLIAINYVLQIGLILLALKLKKRIKTSKKAMD